MFILSQIFISNLAYTWFYRPKLFTGPSTIWEKLSLLGFCSILKILWMFLQLQDYDPYEENPGTAPFSEPETQIMRKLAISFDPHIWVNVHSGMEVNYCISYKLYLYWFPFGYSCPVSPFVFRHFSCHMTIETLLQPAFLLREWCCCSKNWTVFIATNIAWLDLVEALLVNIAILISVLTHLNNSRYILDMARQWQ